MSPRLRPPGRRCGRDVERRRSEGRNEDALRGGEAADRLAEGLGRARLRRLELEDERRPREALKDLFHGRDRQTLAAEWKRAAAVGRPTMPRIERAELGKRQGGDLPAAAGRPIDRLIVHQNQRAILRLADVHLEDVDADRHRSLERPERVLGPESHSAAMRDNQHPIVVEETAGRLRR